MALSRTPMVGKRHIVNLCPPIYVKRQINTVTTFKIIILVIITRDDRNITRQ